MKLMIRLIREEERMLLTEFIYEAIFQKDPGNLIPRTIIQDPSIWIYVDRFGETDHDHCLVAEVDDMIVGAVWARCIHGFGHVDNDTPELAMAVYPQYRGIGIGTQLLEAMICFLKEKRYPQVSLSVDKENYATKMYLRAGFQMRDTNDQDHIMVLGLN